MTYTAVLIKKFIDMMVKELRAHANLRRISVRVRLQAVLVICDRYLLMTYD